jgi:hypothetical protein
MVLACASAVAAGCNDLLGNSDRDMADASWPSFPPDSPDGGPVGALGADGTDSGAGETGHDAQEGADAAGSMPGAGLDGGLAGADTGDGDLTAAPPIAFVQVASQDSKDSVATVSAGYSSPQHEGDLAIVVVGWSDPTLTVRSISDAAGNAYVRAMPPTSNSGVVLATYYAPNIAGAQSNTVTVTLDAPDVLCVAIFEYSGVSQVDGTAMGTGTSNAASTGSVATSLPRELVFGAGEPDQNGTVNFAAAGAGFDERVITGVSGMLGEDRITSQSGSYAASGGLTGSSAWAMQIVTFK